jgi:hypothetical protein
VNRRLDFILSKSFFHKKGIDAFLKIYSCFQYIKERFCFSSFCRWPSSQKIAKAKMGLQRYKHFSNRQIFAQIFFFTRPLAFSFTERTFCQKRVQR